MDRICHVIGGGDFCPERFAPKDDDFIIAADAGYELLENIGITPHITIGDFDSLGFVPNVQRIVLPTVKDDTDTGYAVKWAYKEGFRRFELHGCTGGRVDHTLANIQTLAMLSRLGCDVRMHSQNTTYYALTDAMVCFDNSACGILSVFAHGGCATVSISGLEYELDHADLDPFFPLGVSNSFVGRHSTITVHNGTALIVAPSNTSGNIFVNKRRHQ